MTTEVKNKRALNRLQGIYPLRAYVDKTYKEVEEAKEEGRPTVWCIAGAPTFIFEAMGMKCLFPENFGTVCAAGGAAPAFLERCASEGFPAHLCGYARNCLGYAAIMGDLDGEVPPQAPRGGMPKPTLLAATSGPCDTRHKWFEVLGRYLDVPVWTFENPRSMPREELQEGVNERNIQFTIRQLKELVAFLERLLGRKMDWDKLDEMGTKEQSVRRLWRKFDIPRKARPGPMHSRDFWTAMPTARSMNPDEALPLYQNLYDEVAYRAEHKIAGINRQERYRLIFMGIPPWHSLGFFDKLAERGWNFVTETDYHPAGKPIEIEKDVSMYSDPIERHVRRGRAGLATWIEDNLEPDEGSRIIEGIKRGDFSHPLSFAGTSIYWRTVAAEEFQLDGAVAHNNITCRATTFPNPLIAQQLMARVKVPTLTVEGDLVDLSLFNPEEALRKAEAFEETMDYYRDVRKKAGMTW